MVNSKNSRFARIFWIDHFGEGPGAYIPYKSLNGINKTWAKNKIIMVGKLNYIENDAELDGQWSNLMVKVWFYEE